MGKISLASLYLNEEFIVELTFPELRKLKGHIFIDSYVEKHFFPNEIEDDKYSFPNPILEKFKNRIFKIKAKTESGSEIIFNQVSFKSSSISSSSNYIKLCFYNIDYYTETSYPSTEKIIYRSHLKSIAVEGIAPQFTDITKIIKKRYLFGYDDSRTLSLSLDKSELYFQFFNNKRFYDLKVGIINNEDKENSIIIKFYGDFLIPYRVYLKLKDSITYFISYLAGNNVIVRDEYYIFKKEKDFNHKRIYREYSCQDLPNLKKNHFLPIHDVEFRDKRILQHYLDTLPNYFFINKKLNLSEVIYLINQSKQVNIESSFFVLLIAIEKLSNSLINSNLINSLDNNVIDDKLFLELKPKLIQSFKEIFKGKVSNKQFDIFKSKIGKLNFKNKTDNKIDVLLEFCEIERNSDIDLLFPKLRNLAIHQGEISIAKNDSYKNYQTLFILINSIICNLIQYKGIRFIENQDSKIVTIKKEDYNIDYRGIADSGFLSF